MQRTFFWLIVVAAVLLGAPRYAGGVESRTLGGVEMVRIEAGTFQMGSRSTPDEIQERFGYDFTEGAKAGWADQRPVHEVTISSPFWMATREVTVGEFERFAKATGYRTEAEREGWGMGHGESGFGRIDGVTWREPGWEIDSSHPVVLVSWDDVQAYLDWLREETGEPFRLPTEAEWEYAARAGTTTEFPWGDDPAGAAGRANVLDSFFELDDGAPRTAPVGSYEASSWGLHDMVGNVWEWCADRYAPYPERPVTDPGRLDGSGDRVDRGGGWDAPPFNARVANRGAAGQGFRAVNLGFRLVRDAE